MNEKMRQLLREARRNKGLKQSDVAALLGLKSDGTISNWEKGVSDPDIDSYVKVCKIYGVDFTELLEEAYGDPVEEKQTVECTSEEVELLEMYRALNTESKEFVRLVLDREFQLKVPLAKKKLSSEAG